MPTPPSPRKRGRPRKGEEVYPDAQVARAQELKAAFQEQLLEVSSTPVSREDVRELVRAERRWAKRPITQQIASIARTFSRAEKTVKLWVDDEGLDPGNLLEIFQFVEWKNVRARNKRHLDGRRRRIRSPLD